MFIPFIIALWSASKITRLVLFGLDSNAANDRFSLVINVDVLHTDVLRPTSAKPAQCVDLNGIGTKQLARGHRIGDEQTGAAMGRANPS